MFVAINSKDCSNNLIRKNKKKQLVCFILQTFTLKLASLLNICYIRAIQVQCTQIKKKLDYDVDMAMSFEHFSQ